MKKQKQKIAELLKYFVEVVADDDFANLSEADYIRYQ